MDKHFKEVTFDCWTDLRNTLLDYKDDWIFRGISKYGYPLNSTLDRYIDNQSDIPRNCVWRYERDMISILDRSIHEYYGNSNKILTSNFQKLSFLQHYGAPTRLLDFTFSAFAACFFAIKNMETKGKGAEDGAIWAIDCHAIKKIQYSAIKNLKIDIEEESLALPKKFLDEIISKSYNNHIAINNDGFVGLVNPYFKFDRLSNQKGCFLIQFDIKDTFENNLWQSVKRYNISNDSFIKYRIKKEWRDKVLNEINRMNIDNSTLFPGLDGFIQSLALQTDLSIQIQTKRGDFSC